MQHSPLQVLPAYNILPFIYFHFFSFSTLIIPYSLNVRYVFYWTTTVYGQNLKVVNFYTRSQFSLLRYLEYTLTAVSWKRLSFKSTVTTAILVCFQELKTTPLTSFVQRRHDAYDRKHKWRVVSAIVVYTSFRGNHPSFNNFKIIGLMCNGIFWSVKSNYS